MARHSFKDCFQLLKEIHEYNESIDGEIVSFILDRHTKLKFILNKYDWLRPLISKIGYEKSFELFEQEKFNTTNIKRKAINFQDSEQDKKVVEQLLTYPEIAIGTFIPAVKAKEILKNIYTSLDISKTAKGSDLDIYFVAKSMSKSIKNKVVKGYVPLQRKF